MSIPSFAIPGVSYTLGPPSNPIVSIHGDSSSAAARVFTYQFAESQPGDLWIPYSGWSSISTAERTAFKGILDYIETLINVTFSEVSGQSDPDFNVGKAYADGYAGEGGFQYGYTGNNTVGYQVTQWDNFTVFDAGIDISSGQRNLMLHEIGHAFGLKHTFDTPVLPPEYENNKYSVMSYSPIPETSYQNDYYTFFDIAALQQRWGANLDTATGNDVYAGPRGGLSIDCIWDAGGTDRLDASALSTSVILDLNEGTFSRFGGLYDDVSIAYGVVIENATGGSGNDTLIGNTAANVLTGGAGNDTFHAGATDTLVEIAGGGTTDRVIYSGASAYVLTSAAAIETVELADSAATSAVNITGNAFAQTISGNNGINTINGGGGADRLYGYGGNDHLNGGGGGDYLSGGGGDDRFYANSDDTLAEATGKGTDRVTYYNGTNFVLAAGVSIETMDLASSASIATRNLTGNDFDQTISGNNGSNTINGGGGLDSLYGYDGADTLNGGLGNDRLKGGGGNDIFVFNTTLGAANIDTISDFNGAFDFIHLDNAVMAALGGSGALSGLMFAANAAGTAATPDSRICYDTDSGALYYDADGTGGTARVQFATLTANPSLNAGDFLII